MASAEKLEHILGKMLMSRLKGRYLSKIRKKYNLETFVETGFHKGKGVSAAIRGGFKRIYSCDINISYVDNGKNKFSEYDFVIIENKRSFDFLNNLQKEKIAPALFWLDAHYPVIYGMKKDIESFPLISELEIVSKFPRIENCVIMCDDARSIDAPDNPSRVDPEFFRNLANKAGVDLEYFSHKMDSIYKLKDLFINHKMEISTRSAGVIKFLPYKLGKLND